MHQRITGCASAITLQQISSEYNALHYNALRAIIVSITTGAAMNHKQINQLRGAWGHGLLLLQRIYRPILSEQQVTPAEKRILYGLYKHKALSKQALAKAVVLEPSAITRAMQRLEKQGDIKRCVDDKDRRSIQLTLTPRGKNKIESIQKKALTVFKQACNNIQDNEIAVLTDVLTKININLTKILEESV